MAFILTADQQVPVSVAYTDDHGNPATPDGAPVWETSDDSILTVTAADDGLSALVKAVGPDGQGQVSVTASAGSDQIIGTLDITVVSGAASVVAITPGAAEPQT